MKIKSFAFNPFQENTFVVSDDSGEALIIDAGCYNDAEIEILVDYLETNNLTPTKLVNTHCHIDHIVGVNSLKKKFNIPFAASVEDNYLLETAIQQGIVFGFALSEAPTIDENIEEGKFGFGQSELQVFSVPGHSAGSLAFYSEKNNFVIVGDVLFNGSIGRTDLPKGDYDTLINSITTKLLTLPRDTVVYPGHGPSTTIGKEYDTNPFLK